MAIQYLNGINVSGDVGIGTDSPQKPLDVNGEVLLRDHLFIGGYGENDSTNSIEIGRNRTGDGICFFDMTTDNTTYTDYGFRLIRYSGVNANTELIHRGTGDFRIKGQDASTMTFYTGNSARMRIASNGNVGIGTTSPGYKLDVESSGTAANIKSTQSTGLIVQGGANSTDIAQFKDSTGSTEVVIDTNGNVGIGTTSPSDTLEVAAASQQLRLTDTDDSKYAQFSYSGGNLTIRNNSTTTSAKQITLQEAGNVGIGTISPVGKLSVYRTDTTYAANLSDARSRSSLYLKGSGSLDSELTFSSGLSNVQFIQAVNSAATTGRDIAINPFGGDVGIGTASPQTTLHVSGGTNDSPTVVRVENTDTTIETDQEVNTIQFYSNDSSAAGTGITSKIAQVAENPGNQYGLAFYTYDASLSESLRISENGNVGIGTTSPGYNLDVTGTARITNNMWLGSNIYHDNDGNSAYIGFPADDTWRVVTSGSERLRVNPNGNVGIGVTGPSYALDVNGTVDATIFRAGGVSQYTIYNSTNTYENYGTTISNIASSPVGYLYHDLLAFNYNYTVTQEVSTDGTNFSSETLDKRLFSQKQDQAITVVSSSEYAVRWTIEGTAWSNAKFINLAFTYTNPHPETRVIIESSADGTTWTSRHDSTASGITGTKSCYVSNYSGNNYVRITISKTSSNTNLIKLSSIKMMTARAGDQGDGQELQYPYVWDEDRNMGLLLTKSDLPTSKLDVLGATNTSNSSLLRLRSTSVSPNAPEKVAAFNYNTNTERGYIAVNQYGVTYSTSSDYRLKENVVPLSDATDRLKLLKPCRFNFIEGDPNYIVDGFLAHEAAEVVPESVNGEKDAVDENNEPIYQGIDQGKIVPLLTAALQEAIEKIEQLENRIQTLENN